MKTAEQMVTEYKQGQAIIQEWRAGTIPDENIRQLQVLVSYVIISEEKKENEALGKALVAAFQMGRSQGEKLQMP